MEVTLAVNSMDCFRDSSPTKVAGNPDVMATTWNFGGSPEKITSHFLYENSFDFWGGSNGEVPFPPKKKK